MDAIDRYYNGSDCILCEYDIQYVVPLLSTNWSQYWTGRLLVIRWEYTLWNASLARAAEKSTSVGIMTWCNTVSFNKKWLACQNIHFISCILTASMLLGVIHSWCDRGLVYRPVPIFVYSGLELREYLTTSLSMMWNLHRSDLLHNSFDTQSLTIPNVDPVDPYLFLVSVAVIPETLSKLKWDRVAKNVDLFRTREVGDRLFSVRRLGRHCESRQSRLI